MQLSELVAEWMKYSKTDDEVAINKASEVHEWVAKKLTKKAYF